MKYILPEDLKKHITKKISIRICSCILMLAVMATVLILFGDRIFAPDSQLYRIKEVFCVALIILIFYITGVPLKLIDRTFYGTVEKVSVTPGYVSKVNGGRQSPMNSRTVSNKKLQAVNIMAISVRTTDGKLITRKAFSSPAANEEDYDELFRIGDNVFHLYGTQVYVKIPKDKHEKISCPICGVPNVRSDRSCSNCRHTLIKNRIDMN